MKVLSKDLKKGKVKVEVQSLDDLWFLSHIIDEEDLVSGKTVRKIKLGEGTDRNVKIIKKSLFLTIQVEKIEFHRYTNSLRVSGKIAEGTEDAPKGSYHTFDLEEGTVISIEKTQWLKFQLEKLKEASQEKSEKILLIALDREEVSYALLTQSGYKMLADVEGEVSKKGYEETKGKDFYSEIAKQVEDYVKRFEIQYIVLASPAFWKEDVLKIIKKRTPELVKKITLATCNTTGQSGIEEILKRDEVKTVLRQDRTTKETQLVEELFKEIATQGNVAYGYNEVKLASDAHAIKKLLVTDEHIHELREQNNFAALDAIMKEVDRTDGDVHIISTEHDAGKKLQGLGGLGAILRYKIN